MRLSYVDSIGWKGKGDREGIGRIYRFWGSHRKFK